MNRRHFFRSLIGASAAAASVPLGAELLHTAGPAMLNPAETVLSSAQQGRLLVHLSADTAQFERVIRERVVPLLIKDIERKMRVR